MDREAIGVILLNLGGPERLEDVRPFLYNLFSDRKIIRLGPPFLQKTIAWWIAKKRAPKSMESYRLIGGGSPLNTITAQQCHALETALAPFGDFKVVMAMRYWQPSAREALTALRQSGVSKIIALTLYPHYSIATTGSSLDDLRLAAAGFTPAFDIHPVESWPDEPNYLQALAAAINKKLQEIPADKVEIIYSAHSLPVKFIQEGDPYLEHLNRTISGVENITGKKGRLCFQSRSGPVEWLSPSTPEMLEQLAAEQCSKVVAVPISFVSDHVETLYEIDIQYNELARDLGIELYRTDSLNVQPDFIAALKHLVVEECTSRKWLTAAT